MTDFKNNFSRIVKVISPPRKSVSPIQVAVIDKHPRRIFSTSFEELDDTSNNVVYVKSIKTKPRKVLIEQSQYTDQNAVPYRVEKQAETNPNQNLIVKTESSQKFYQRRCFDSVIVLKFRVIVT